MLSAAAAAVEEVEGGWARRAVVRASASRMAWEAPFDPTVLLVSEGFVRTGLGLTRVHRMGGIT
jgi:hypothetical protein